MAYTPCQFDPITAESCITAFPSLVLQSVSTAGPTTRPPHNPLPSYSGTGSLLKGYCSTLDFALFDQGTKAYWVGVIGCINDKLDCCPYPATSPGLGPVPYPVSLAALTLARCPDDYQVVDIGCCPLSYSRWNAGLGYNVLCYSSLKSDVSPPPIPVTPLSMPITTTGSGSTQKPTSAIVNIVYAVQYQVQPAAQGLQPGAIGGIVIGAILLSIVIIGLANCFIRGRKHKKYNAAIPTAQTAPPVSQAPAAYPPPDQNAYVQAQQTQQGLTPGGYFGQKLPEQQVEEGPAQSPMLYQSPLSSTAPLGPPSEGYNYQTGYVPSTATSELPDQRGYQSQTASSSAGSPTLSAAFSYAAPGRKAVPKVESLMQ